MKIVYYVYKTIKICRLWIVKLKYSKRLELLSALSSYNLSVDTDINIGENGKLILDSISTSSGVYFSAWKGVLQIGKGCCFNRNDIIVSHKKIKIGDGTILGPNVCIYDHDHEFDENGIVAGEYRLSEVNIGKRVWIGAGTIILRGSNIGDNSVIGAGCVINGDIPAHSLVVAQNRELKISALRKKREITNSNVLEKE